MNAISDGQIGTTIERPKSATHGLVSLAATIAFVAAFLFLHRYDPFHDTVDSLIAMVLFVATAIFLTDQCLQRNRTVSAQPGAIGRSAVKMLGFLATLGLVAAIYFLFPLYHGKFYDPYYTALSRIALPALVLAFPYIYLTDRRMAQPYDGTWSMGMAALGKWHKVDCRILRQYCLTWLVKLFFIPLMFAYACGNFDLLGHYNFTNITHNSRELYAITSSGLYFLDVVIALLGYVFALRWFGTHVRSAEPTLLGWVAALLCYAPFWDMLTANYVQYGTGREWGDWFKTPVLYDIWGIGILICVAIYAWATVSFGARFSNLTNRGIITNGPYRFTKHPAYIAKNASWWMIALPFLGPDPWLCVRCCCMLLVLNGIYYLRARTEERHLSLDPAYRDYAAWIAQHGLFRRLRLKPMAPLDPAIIGEPIAPSPVE